MASKVDIGNLALSHLGDTANVSDFEEQSANADHLKMWYPIALNSALEAHAWKFAQRRVQLAEVAVLPEIGAWGYCYQAPGDMVRAHAVLLPQAMDIDSRPFATESDEDGNIIVLTDISPAILRYTRLVEDTTKFSPLFVDTLTWLLASYLAGPVVKGDAGIAAGERAYQAYLGQLARASASDANQQQRPDTYTPQGIQSRGGRLGTFNPYLSPGRIIR